MTAGTRYFDSYMREDCNDLYARELVYHLNSCMCEDCNRERENFYRMVDDGF